MEFYNQVKFVTMAIQIQMMDVTIVLLRQALPVMLLGMSVLQPVEMVSE